MIYFIAVVVFIIAVLLVNIVRLLMDIKWRISHIPVNDFNDTLKGIRADLRRKSG